MTARALTTRYLDFWLLGGASVVLWAVMSFAQWFRTDAWAVDQHFANTGALATTLALVVNHPHFMASYKLAYGRGWRFIRQFWFQLILAPLLLIAALAAAYGVLSKPSVAAPEALGRDIMGYLVILMFMTVGWHYSKQVYGCMMVYGHYDGYRMSGFQRRLVKYSLFLVWWVHYIHSNSSGTEFDFYGIRYAAFRFPEIVQILAPAVLGLSAVAVIYFVFVKNFKANGQRPGWNFLIPYVAFYVWWSPMTFQSEFYLLATPFFHSLQYLAFVYKTEDGRLSGNPSRSKEIWGTAVIAGLIVAGFLSFELGPNLLDKTLQTEALFKFAFFFVAAQVFINVHHYFIDNALWRFNDPEVKKYLL